MKFALMNYHYLRYPIERFLDKAADSPFDHIDLYCAAPQMNMFDYTLQSLIMLDKEISSRKLNIMALTPENCTYPINFCTQDRTTRENSIRYYQRAVDSAEFLGCRNVQISTGFGYFDRPVQEAWNYCRESLGELVVYCERKNVRLLLEELKETTTNVLLTSLDIGRMLKEIDSPNIVGLVDLDQMTYAGETLDDYFKHLGSRLCHVHFNDRGHTVPGDGDFPMKEHFETLERNNYSGNVSFEICDRRYYRDPDAATDKLILWMKDHTNVFAG